MPLWVSFFRWRLKKIFWKNVGNQRVAGFPLTSIVWKNTMSSFWLPTISIVWVNYPFNTRSLSVRMTYPHNPLHRLQLQRLFVAFQHLLQIFIPAEKTTIQHYSHSYLNTVEEGSDSFTSCTRMKMHHANYSFSYKVKVGLSIHSKSVSVNYSLFIIQLQFFYCKWNKNNICIIHICLFTVLKEQKHVWLITGRLFL